MAWPPIALSSTAVPVKKYWGAVTAMKGKGQHARGQGHQTLGGVRASRAGLVPNHCCPATVAANCPVNRTCRTTLATPCARCVRAHSRLTGAVDLALGVQAGEVHVTVALVRGLHQQPASTGRSVKVVRGGGAEVVVWLGAAVRGARQGAGQARGGGTKAIVRLR